MLAFLSSLSFANILIVFFGAIFIVVPLAIIVNKIRGKHADKPVEYNTVTAFEENKEEHTFDEAMSQLPPLEPWNSDGKGDSEESRFEKLYDGKKYHSRTTFVNRMVNTEREAVLKNAAETIKKDKEE